MDLESTTKVGADGTGAIICGGKRIHRQRNDSAHSAECTDAFAGFVLLPPLVARNVLAAAYSSSLIDLH
jgi:hypothetical protein